MQTLRRLRLVSETWWLELQGFQFAHSTVRASLHLSGSTTGATSRKDAVTPEKLCNCTSKPWVILFFLTQNIAVVAEIKFWFVTVKSLMNLQVMLEELMNQVLVLQNTCAYAPWVFPATPIATSACFQNICDSDFRRKGFVTMSCTDFVVVIVVSNNLCGRW